MVTKTDLRDSKIRCLLDESQTGSIIAFYKKKPITVVGVEVQPSWAYSTPWPADIPVAIVLEDGEKREIAIRYIRLSADAEKEIEARFNAKREEEKADKIRWLQAQLAKLQK